MIRDNTWEGHPGTRLLPPPHRSVSRASQDRRFDRVTNPDKVELSGQY
jgi:hypothetical protein